MTKEEYEAKKRAKHQCRNCEHSRINPQDINSRVCRGAPPCLIAIPQGMGKVALQSHYPLVGATDEGCSLFKPKLLIDNEPPSILKQ